MPGSDGDYDPDGGPPVPQAALNHARPHLGAWDWTTPAMKRQPLLPHVARRVAHWHPPTAAALVVAVGLVLHEIVYHLSGGTDFPLTVLFDGSRVFAISHGGLDALAVGILAVSMLLLIDAAQVHGGER